MANADNAEQLHRHAIDLLARTRIRTDEARSHLLHGQCLRRQRRRSDARQQLQTAYDMFIEMGAPFFASRANRELEAAVGGVGERGTPGIQLTPQEAAVADLASAGATNAEIAARLFIGQTTVEYHLRKVFRKRGISSHRELQRRAEASSEDVPPDALVGLGLPFVSAGDATPRSGWPRPRPGWSPCWTNWI
jgi:DNA-binding CsgD family transcriptional regulator